MGPARAFVLVLLPATQWGCFTYVVRQLTKPLDVPIYETQRTAEVIVLSSTPTGNSIRIERNHWFRVVREEPHVLFLACNVLSDEITEVRECVRTVYNVKYRVYNPVQDALEVPTLLLDLPLLLLLSLAKPHRRSDWDFAPSFRPTDELLLQVGTAMLPWFMVENEMWFREEGEEWNRTALRKVEGNVARGAGLAFRVTAGISSRILTCDEAGILRLDMRHFDAQWEPWIHVPVLFERYRAYRYRYNPVNGALWEDQ